MMTQNLSDLAISYAATEGLIAYSRNARTHSKHQIRQIADSIRAFGFTNPVLIDERNTIVAGHGRVAAARLLGIDSVPTIQLEHLSKEQIRAYVLADNKLAENAGWDKSILAIELQHLILSDEILDVTVTGFEVPEIDLIIQSAIEATEEAEEPETLVPTVPVTQLGDLWQPTFRHLPRVGAAALFYKQGLYASVFSTAAACGENARRGSNYCPTRFSVDTNSIKD